MLSRRIGREVAITSSHARGFKGLQISVLLWDLECPLLGSKYYVHSSGSRG